MWLEVEDADGPPPPPFVRRRRRRRNALLGVAALIIAGVPLVLGVISNSDRQPDDTAAMTPEADPDPPDASDEGTPGEEDGGDTSADDRLTQPDLSGLDGVDEQFARLLGDIDASEVSMMGFQDQLAGALQGEAAGDQDALVEAIRDAARSGQRGLADVRERLLDQFDDTGADAVRLAYLRHLDSWAEYMAAVEDDPAILAVQDRTRVYTLAINVTADTFARTLEEQLPDDVDGDVRRFADEILERGFRGFGESNV